MEELFFNPKFNKNTKIKFIPPIEKKQSIVHWLPKGVKRPIYDNFYIGKPKPFIFYDIYDYKDGKNKVMRVPEGGKIHLQLKEIVETGIIPKLSLLSRIKILYYNLKNKIRRMLCHR